MRAQLRNTVQDRRGNAQSLVTVHVYEPGTTNEISATMYENPTGLDVLSNPLTTDGNGEFAFFLDAPQQVDLVVVENTITRTIPSVAVGSAEPIEGGSGNPTLIFKTADQANTTTSFTNDDELRFTVVAGHRYVARLNLYASSNTDGSIPDGTVMTWDVPTDVVAAFGLYATGALFGDPVAAELGSNQHSAWMLEVDAALNGGEIVFQFRCPDGTTTGGVTVKGGSMIELFDLGVIP